MSSSISIKNQAFSLPVIEITQFDIVKIINDLKQRVVTHDERIESIPCVLSMPNQQIEPTFLAQLVEALRQVNLQAVGLLTDDESLAEKAVYAGLSVFDERLNQYDLFHPLPEENSSDPQADLQMVHQGHVEPGEQIYAENRDLIILGDVKAGAEVIADGDIYIGGTLQGRAYAGNAGLINVDQTSIRAYCFEPELVSISGFYQLLEDIPKKYHGLSIKVNFLNQKMNFVLE